MTSLEIVTIFYILSLIEYRNLVLCIIKTKVIIIVKNFIFERSVIGSLVKLELRNADHFKLY